LASRPELLSYPKYFGYLCSPGQSDSRQSLLYHCCADRVPTAHNAAAPHYASKQHCSRIKAFIKNSITSNICSTLEAYDEDHDGDRVVLFFCFLQELSVAPREVLVLAEEALHPMKLMLSNFN